MPGPKPPALDLIPIEQQALEKLVNRHNVGQQIALRGRIILAAAEGKNNSEIARKFGVTLDTVRLWRGRWRDLQSIPLADLSAEERLQDLPRPGLRPSSGVKLKRWPAKSRKAQTGPLVIGRVGK